MNKDAITKQLSSQISKRLLEDKNYLNSFWLSSAGAGIDTRYFIVDNLLNDDFAHDIYSCFEPTGDFWNSVDNFRERKSSFQKIDQLSPILSCITDAFHEKSVISSIAEITCISGLESDPSLYAGGISIMKQGDYLNPHIDNSHDALRQRYRRLNLLYYVTPEWLEDFGGNLELWDTSVSQCKRIPAFFNRLVVMETNALSWHSVDPICHNGYRTCISNYYFTKQSPEDRDYYHVTSFLGRPNQHLQRGICRIDNFLRQSFVLLTGTARGASRGRF